MIMEYRAYIEIPTFPGEPDEAWMRLLAWLDENTDMGPALNGPAPEGASGVTVILSTDADDEAAAVRAMVDATTHALEAIDLGEHYPASIEIQHADDEQLVTA